MLLVALARALAAPPLLPAQQQEADALLSTRVIQALINDPVLGQYALAVGVETDGEVLLQGRLPTKQDKDLAGRRAKAVTGVKRVDNRIQVDATVAPLTAPVAAAAPARAATAADIQTRVQNALAAHPELRGVTASVSEEVVTLSGTVASAAERDQALAVAKQNAAGLPVVNQIRVAQTPRR